MVKSRQTVNIKKNSFEMAAWAQDQFVIGIDEVGRGCIAGPVVAAAVILPLNKANRKLKDSKIMTPEEREEAFQWISKHCNYGIGIVHHRIIDKHNIYRATLIAMKRAIINLLEISSVRPTAVLIDAMPLNLADTHFHDMNIHYFPKGESKSSSIAAASIVAKVTRDAMMELYDAAIPGYKWADNKGYRTPSHKRVVREHHHSIIHRLRFLANINNREDISEAQLSLDIIDAEPIEEFL